MGSGNRVSILSRSAIRLRSLYIGFLPFCMLEGMRTLGEYSVFKDDKEDNEVIELEDDSGKIVKHDPDDYDWDKHEEDMDRIN